MTKVFTLFPKLASDADNQAISDVIGKGPPEPGVPYRNALLVVPKLTADQKQAFREVAPTALWIAANLNGPQQRYWGDNQGAWPVRMGLTQAWNDKVTVTWDRDPWQPRGVMCRVWFDDYDTADKIWCRVYQALRGRFEDERREWLAFDPETTLGDITAEILTHASELRVDTYTDDEMVKRLDALIAMAKKLQERFGK